MRVILNLRSAAHGVPPRRFHCPRDGLDGLVEAGSFVAALAAGELIAVIFEDAGDAAVVLEIMAAASCRARRLH